MHGYENLESMLTRLKLTATRDRLTSLLEEASKKELNLRDFLEFICETEIAQKNQHRIQINMNKAKFPFLRSIEDFDFKAQPSINQKKILELASGRWIGNSDNVLFLGPPGVGKTHLAIALARKAIQMNYSAYFASATVLMANLAKAHLEGKLEKQLDFFSKPKLLVIDEIGYLPFEKNAAYLFFQLISRRYEKGSVMLTSNRTVGEWGEIFSDVAVATAILDRILHHSHVITIRGDSYRLKEKQRSGLIKTKFLLSKKN